MLQDMSRLTLKYQKPASIMIGGQCFEPGHVFLLLQSASWKALQKRLAYVELSLQLVLRDLPNVTSQPFPMVATGTGVERLLHVGAIIRLCYRNESLGLTRHYTR
jgi:hypothetical protein